MSWTFLLLLPLVYGKDCYWNSKDAYQYFGSKTPYDAVRGDIRDVPHVHGCKVVSVWAMLRHGNRHPKPDEIVVMKQAADLKSVIVDNYMEGLGEMCAQASCEVVSVWAMLRHGNRHPGADDIVGMKQIADLKSDIVNYHVEGLGEMCAQDIADLKIWKWNQSTEDTPAYLTEIGYQEHLDLGSRFNEKFHGLLKKLDEYEFRPSIEERTKESAVAFTKGLGQDEFSFNVSEPMEADEVVRPYKICPKYEEEVKHSKERKKQERAFFNSDEFTELEKNVRKRLGLQFSLTRDNITGLYDLCRYYRSYSIIKRDPWCAAFSNQDLEIMEYSDDVRHYYRNGYGGAPVTEQLGALAFKDLYQKFGSSRNNSLKSFTAYFSHDTMLDMMFSSLGLYWDYPEVAGFYRDKDRKWKTSFMVPFAANFVAVLYKCKDDEGFKIKFLINEVEIPLCKSWYCEWEEFEEKFQKFANANMSFCFI